MDAASQRDVVVAELAPRANFSLREFLLLFIALGAAFGLLNQLSSPQPSIELCILLVMAWLGPWIWLLHGQVRSRVRDVVWIASLPAMIVSCVWALHFREALYVQGPLVERAQCERNLRRIALALHAYHDVYGCFPPAYMADSAGRPLHSWRVLILPYLGEQALYDQYDFGEPWDGPNNRLLGPRMPAFYCCGSRRPRGKTSYTTVVGPRTAWPGTTSTALSDFTDGAGSCLLLVEGKPMVDWLRPDGMQLAEMEFRQGSNGLKRMAERHPGGTVVVFADGSVDVLPHDLSEAEVRELFTIDDGGPRRRIRAR